MLSFVRCSSTIKTTTSEIIPIEREKFRLLSCREENPANPEVCIRIIDPMCLISRNPKCCNNYALCAGDIWYVRDGNELMLGRLYKINTQTKKEITLSNFQPKGNDLTLIVPEIGKLIKEEKLLISFTPTNKFTKVEEFEIKKMNTR